MVIRGKVVKGKGEGRTLGFPTANLDYASKEAPAPGVYAARARVAAAPTYVGAAAVVGMWTLPDGRPSVEVHLIEEIKEGEEIERYTHRDLYGQEIVVAFYDKIRDLKKFESEDELVAQIRDDLAVCSQRLKQNSC